MPNFADLRDEDLKLPLKHLKCAIKRGYCVIESVINLLTATVLKSILLLMIGLGVQMVRLLDVAQVHGCIRDPLI